MERIKNSNQLRFERSKRLQRKAELEKAIQQDWGHLKDELKPGHAANKLFHAFLRIITKKIPAFLATCFLYGQTSTKKKRIKYSADNKKLV